jgi:hypothetical protein
MAPPLADVERMRAALLAEVLDDAARTVIEEVEAAGSLSLGEIARKTRARAKQGKATRHLKALLARLVTTGHLQRRGRGGHSRYVLGARR